MGKFTCDALVRLAVQKRKQAAADAKPNRVSDAGGAKPPVDLNEIHRRFWARQAGKE
jgi:hypothetical protein